MGLTAAVLRIQRDEKDKYPEQDSSYSALWKKGQMSMRHYFGWREER
jgi:hypothetical protein